MQRNWSGTKWFVENCLYSETASAVSAKVAQATSDHNAFLHFVRDNPSIDSIIMKNLFSGHSCVQEVDHAHSEIEKLRRKADFYSLIG